MTPPHRRPPLRTLAANPVPRRPTASHRLGFPAGAARDADPPAVVPAHPRDASVRAAVRGARVLQAAGA